ncbi:MAG: ATP-binding protein [Phycisphaerales bacterium]
MSTRMVDATTHILVIDDDPMHRELLIRSVQRASTEHQPFVASGYSCPDEAIHAILPDSRVVLIIDLVLGSESGIDWLPDLTRANLGPVILTTSDCDPNDVAEAFHRGATGFLTKNHAFEDPTRLRRTIVEAIRRYRLQSSRTQLSESLKRSNHDLGERNAQLDALTRTAHRFVDEVAHDFRTPLAVIQEFTSIMADGLGGPVTSQQLEFLEHVTNASRDLGQLVDDFLDSSRLKAGSLRVNRERQCVDELLATTWPILESRAARKSITVRREVADDLPMLRADANNLRRTLMNLVINAIKVSNPGSEIVVSVAQDASADTVRFSVTDEGPGLSDAQMNSMFERFQCGPGSGPAEMVRGFGLGLSIVRELVTMNFGTVEVTSTPGQGSTFSFTVPRDTPEAMVRSFMQLGRLRPTTGGVAVLEISNIGIDLSLDELSAHIAAVAHPADLVLSSPVRDSILLVGDAGDVLGWIHRLNRGLRDLAQRVADIDLAPLSPSHLGTWTIDDAQPRLLGVLTAKAGV